ncbi:methylase of polypeptide chain release factors [Bacillus sp. JCM 19045]|nr:methylase of polypeptide chain release factors [Bacillus sp. JCM 19045]
MGPKIYEALRWASSFLLEKELEAPAGEWLLRHHTGMERSSLLASMHDELSEPVWLAFQADVERLTTGIPVQHLIGSEQFFGRTFRVSEHVLIPRPETEELIAQLLERMPEKPLSIVDIGTGSGAIAITIKLERPGDHVAAIDLSKQALEVAKENAVRLSAAVEFLQGDLLAPLAGQTFDVLISNPPYIPEGDKDSLSIQVREYEPHGALFAGVDGLEIYRRLAREMPKYTKVDSIIGLEIGAGQGEAVQALFKSAFPNANVDICFDINKKDRMIIVSGDMSRS